MKVEQSLYGVIKETTKQFPNRSALLFMNKYLTYEQIINKIDALSSGFNDIGIKEGDVITLALPNVFEAVFALYALNKIGVVCHMVHPISPINQMKKFIKQTKSRCLIVLDTFFNHYKELLEYNNKLILVSPVNEFNFIKKIGYKLINLSKLSKVKYSENVIRFKDLYSAIRNNEIAVNPKKTAFLLHSGGTSGEPKTIELSNFAINSLASQAPHIMGTKDFEDMHMLAVLPMFHGFGLCMGIHGMMFTGGINTLMPKFSSDETIKLIKKNRCNVIIGVPSLFESLLRNKLFKDESIKNIKQAYVGGDYVTLDLKHRFDEVMKYYYSDARLLEGYGLTEVVTVCSVNTLRDNNLESVGKPLPGISIKIIDQETQAFLEDEEAGEIIVKGPTMMNGYLNDKESTDKTMINIDGEKWIKTGDLGFIDKQGYLYFKQRLKRIIKVSGMPVLPSEIENLLMNYEQISEVAAIGIKDEFTNFKVKLFIVWKNKSNILNESEIKKAIKENISIYAIPKEIEYLHSLPKTPIGKVDVLKLEKL